PGKSRRPLEPTGRPGGPRLSVAGFVEVGEHAMSFIEAGGIDCDIHPAVPSLKVLHPYLTDHWRDIIVQRGVHELNSIAYPANSPLTARPDWRVDGIRPG